jgi:hypothetical protein
MLTASILISSIIAVQLSTQDANGTIALRRSAEHVAFAAASMVLIAEVERRLNQVGRIAANATIRNESAKIKTR